jgi:hypothetical protein
MLRDNRLIGGKRVDLVMSFRTIDVCGKCGAFYDLQSRIRTCMLCFRPARILFYSYTQAKERFGLHKDFDKVFQKYGANMQTKNGNYKDYCLVIILSNKLVLK